MSTPEGRVKSKLKKYLKDKGILYFMPVSNGMGTHGVSDFIACVPVEITADMVGQKMGVFTAIEAKAEGLRGKENRGASPLQMTFLAKVMSHYGLGMIADCVEDVAEVLDAIEFECAKSKEQA